MKFHITKAGKAFPSATTQAARTMEGDHEYKSVEADCKRKWASHEHKVLQAQATRAATTEAEEAARVEADAAARKFEAAKHANREAISREEMLVQITPVLRKRLDLTLEEAWIVEKARIEEKASAAPAARSPAPAARSPAPRPRSPAPRSPAPRSPAAQAPAAQASAAQAAAPAAQASAAPALAANNNNEQQDQNPAEAPVTPRSNKRGAALVFPTPTPPGAPSGPLASDQNLYSPPHEEYSPPTVGPTVGSSPMGPIAGASGAFAAIAFAAPAPAVPGHSPSASRRSEINFLLKPTSSSSGDDDDGCGNCDDEDEDDFNDDEEGDDEEDSNDSRGSDDNDDGEEGVVHDAPEQGAVLDGVRPDDPFMGNDGGPPPRQAPTNGFGGGKQARQDTGRGRGRGRGCGTRGGASGGVSGGASGGAGRGGGKKRKVKARFAKPKEKDPRRGDEDVYGYDDVSSRKRNRASE